MKIRSQFVSNSSSTSFCIVGINTRDKNYDDLLKKLRPTQQLAEKIKYYNPEYWYYGHGLFPIDDEKLEGFGYGEEDLPDYIGIDAEKILENKSLKQARKEFCKYIKKNYDEDVDEKDVELIYGEVGNG